MRRKAGTGWGTLGRGRIRPSRPAPSRGAPGGQRDRGDRILGPSAGPALSPPGPRGARVALLHLCYGSVLASLWRSTQRSVLEKCIGSAASLLEEGMPSFFSNSSCTEQLPCAVSFSACERVKGKYIRTSKTYFGVPGEK